MILPKLHYISQGNSPEEHLDNISKACSLGAELVQLRLKNSTEASLLKTAQKAREITQHYQTRLIINDYYKIAKQVKSDGVHLGKTDCCPTLAKKHLYSWQIIGGTANTLQDCNILINKEVNYIGLGPFRFTQTKNNLSPVLGRKGYAEILDKLQTKIPVIAIGGITVNDTEAILDTGVYGLAASGEITRDFNKIHLFHKTLQAPSVREKVWKPNQNT